MSSFDFSEGLERLLRSRDALSSARTRELAAEFIAAQASVCRRVAALRYPLARMVLELDAGRIDYFREGSDKDRNSANGKKASYRFAGFTPAHADEIGRIMPEDRMAEFLMGFTFEVIEMVAQRADPAPAAAEAAVFAMHNALAMARRMRDELVSGNLLLVAKVAKRRCVFCGTSVPDDLFAAGVDGLMIAINRYDPSVGFFSTYAMPWLRLAIDRFVAKTSHLIHIPIGLQSKKRRDEAAALIPTVQSIDEPIPDQSDGSLSLSDVVPDSPESGPLKTLEREDVARILSEGLGRLDLLKQFVLSMRCEIADAASLGAKLFQKEIALSLERGRSTVAAAEKVTDEPAQVVIHRPLSVVGAAENGQTGQPSHAGPDELAIAG